MTSLLEHDATFRIGAFVGVLVLMALVELVLPHHPLPVGRARRWPGNLGVVLIDTALVRLLLPTTAIGMALLAEDRQWGLLHAIALPEWIAVLLAVVVLDLVIYGQHVLFHAVPAFWRLHRMHHADLELDVTTGIRFHPIEILLSMLLKFAAIVILGAPAVAVLIFEVLLNATSMFNHANVDLPPRLERILRWIVVTPGMHRVHHSIDRRETNSNFGFNLPWWDRLFATYREEPRSGPDNITFGIPEIRDPAEQRLDKMLVQPFRRFKL